MLSDGAIWTLDHLDELDRKFVQRPDESKRSFDVKFGEQLADVSEGARHLAAEFLWLLFLFVGTLMSPQTMRSQIRRVWNNWSDNEGPESPYLDEPLEIGIGNPGAAYNYNRPFELAFSITLAREFKGKPPEEQGRLLESPWAFANWLDSIEQERRPQLRDILLHLLFPDDFERIASRGDKQDVLAAFGELVDDGETTEVDSEDTARDRYLLAARENLEKRLGQERLDFYEPPLSRLWLSARRQGISEEVLSPLEALEHRRQIILYGPPGTGKTYMAHQLAVRAVQKAALHAYGAEYFDRKTEQWEEFARQRVHHLQLHPGWSYESFIGGLRLTEGLGTRYEPGYLPRLINRMDEEADRQRDLPHVLILDEINRTDLSRLLGEAFWALEYRDQPAHIGAVDPTGREHTLRIPWRLLVIGTMNLIDQSLEEIDFALRRRFVWFSHGFSEEAAEAVMRARWQELADENDVPAKRWSSIEPDVQRLLAAAAALNREIRQDEYLGARYEIGHTYFTDTLHMVVDRQKHGNPRRVFWTSNKPAPPLVALWEHHLYPLLEQYLAGLDPQLRSEKLSRWRDVLYNHRPEGND